MSELDRGGNTSKPYDIEKLDNLINTVLSSCDNLLVAVVQVVDCNEDIQNVPTETENRRQMINEPFRQMILSPRAGVNNNIMNSSTSSGKNRSRRFNNATTKLGTSKSTSKSKAKAKNVKSSPSEKMVLPAKVSKNDGLDSWHYPGNMEPEKQEVANSNIGQVSQRTPHLRNEPRRKRKVGSKSKAKSKSKSKTSKKENKPSEINQPGSLSKTGITASSGTEVNLDKNFQDSKVIKNYSKEKMSSSIQESVESYLQLPISNLFFPRSASSATVLSRNKNISYLKLFKFSKVPTFKQGNSKNVSVSKEVYKWDDDRDNVGLFNQIPPHFALNNHEDKFVIINVDNVNKSDSSTIGKPPPLIKTNSNANLYEDEIATPKATYSSEKSASRSEPRTKSEKSNKSNSSRKSRIKFGRTVNMISSAIRDFYDVSNGEPDLFKVRKSQDQNQDSKISLKSNFSTRSQEDDESFKIFKILNGPNKPASMFGSIVRVLEPTTCHPGSIVIEQPLLTPSVTIKSSKSDSDRLGLKPFSRSHSCSDIAHSNSSKLTPASTQNFIKDYSGTIDNHINASGNFGSIVIPGAEINAGNVVEITYNQASPAVKSIERICRPMFEINLAQLADQPTACLSSTIGANEFTNGKDINGDIAVLKKLNYDQNVFTNNKTAEPATVGQKLGFPAKSGTDKDSCHDKRGPKEHMPKQKNFPMEAKKRNCKIVAEWRKSSNKGLGKKAKPSSNVAKTSSVVSNDETVFPKKQKTSKSRNASSQRSMSAVNEHNMPTIAPPNYSFCNMLEPSTNYYASTKFLDTPEFHVSNTITKESRFKFYISTTVDINEEIPLNISSKCHNYEYTVDTFPKDGPHTNPALVVKMKKCKNG